MNDLIKKARGFESNPFRGATGECDMDRLELAIEVLKGTVTSRAAAKALGLKSHTHVYYKIPAWLRWGMQRNLIKIERV